MKKTENLITKFFSVVLLVIIALSFCGCGTEEAVDMHKILKKRWDIDIPQSFTLIYLQEEYDGNLFGEGDLLCIFTFDEEYDFFEDFEREKDPKFESDVNSMDKILKNAKYSIYNPDYAPDFEKEYYWKKSMKDGIDKLFLICYPDDGRLYVYEDIR